MPYVRSIQGKEKKMFFWEQNHGLVSYLITPLEHIFLTLLHLVVDVEKLDDAVLSDVVGIFLGFLPVERRAHWQQTHLTDRLGASTGSPGERGSDLFQEPWLASYEEPRRASIKSLQSRNGVNLLSESFQAVSGCLDTAWRNDNLSREQKKQAGPCSSLANCLAR